MFIEFIHYIYVSSLQHYTTVSVWQPHMRVIRSLLDKAKIQGSVCLQFLHHLPMKDKQL